MILVVGGTGSLGGRIAQSLLMGEEPVRALVRPASDASALERSGAEIVRGDLRDPASLDRACAGVRALVTTATTTRRGDDRIENVDGQGNENLVTAAQKAGVEHFVFVSTAGAAAASPVPAFRAKGAAEDALKASGIGYTVLQPAAFMDVWFGMMIELPLFTAQPVTLVGESRGRHSFIAEQDVCSFAVGALRNPAARDATLLLGGPEAITFRDAVHAYERALGRSIATVSVPPGAPIPGLPEPVWGLAASLDAHDNIIPMEAQTERFRVTLTSVDAFALSRAPALAAAPLTSGA